MKTFQKFHKKTGIGLPKKSIPRNLESKTERELVTILDKEASFYVRTANPVWFDGNGTVIAQCYTCGKQADYRTMDCGHYIPRHRFATRWNLDNIRTQCTACNSYHEGEHWLFRDGLVRELGLDRVEAMEREAMMAGLVHKDRFSIIEAINTFRFENKILKKRYGL